MSIIIRNRGSRALWRGAALLAGMGIATGAAMAGAGYGGPYGFGQPATPQDIAMINIDAMPDGRGLPAGQGTYEEGAKVYEKNCLSCHGAKLEGVKGLGNKLIGGRGSLTSGSPVKTIESYWPYASTVFDYVKRAMPFNAPGSLSDNDVYAVTAYILGEADIIDKSTPMNATTLPKVQMPNRDGFIADSRPDVRNYD